MHLSLGFEILREEEKKNEEWKENMQICYKYVTHNLQRHREDSRLEFNSFFIIFGYGFKKKAIQPLKNWLAAQDEINYLGRNSQIYSFDVTNIL